MFIIDDVIGIRAVCETRTGAFGLARVRKFFEACPIFRVRTFCLVKKKIH